MFGFGLDYCRSILHDGKGAAFVPSPASGELLPFGYQVIELTGYSDMWGEYRDSLHCKVIQFFNPKFSIRNGISSRYYLFFEQPLLVLNNGNPRAAYLIRSQREALWLVIRPNLICHYLAGRSFKI